MTLFVTRASGGDGSLENEVMHQARGSRGESKVSVLSCNGKHIHRSYIDILIFTYRSVECTRTHVVPTSEYQQQ